MDVFVNSAEEEPYLHSLLLTLTSGVAEARHIETRFWTLLVVAHIPLARVMVSAVGALHHRYTVAEPVQVPALQVSENSMAQVSGY